MNPDELSVHRAGAVDAVTRLAEHVAALLLCCDLIEAADDREAALRLRRSLVRATTALHALREVLVHVEIVERDLRARTSAREPSS